MSALLHARPPGARGGLSVLSPPQALCLATVCCRGLAALVPHVGEGFIIPTALGQLVEWSLDPVRAIL